MPREKLIPPDNADDRSFEEQMNDLGVEVVKPGKPEFEWYEPMFGRNNKGGLKDRISINSGGITIGSIAVERIGLNSFITVGVVKIKNKNFMAIKPGKI